MLLIYILIRVTAHRWLAIDLVRLLLLLLQQPVFRRWAAVRRAGHAPLVGVGVKVFAQLVGQVVALLLEVQLQLVLAQVLLRALHVHLVLVLLPLLRVALSRRRQALLLGRRKLRVNLVLLFVVVAGGHCLLVARGTVVRVGLVVEVLLRLAGSGQLGLLQVGRLRLLHLALQQQASLGLLVSVFRNWLLGFLRFLSPNFGSISAQFPLTKLNNNHTVQ